MANGTGLAVAHADASKTKPSPRPLQIIRLGTAEENFSFHLEQANLDSIMAQVPSDMKVAVVSVVGAFRTGKSFLLTFLLRYLRYGSELDDSEDWMTAAGDLREGNINEKVLAGDDGRNALESSFQWRAGKERTTTGIWMWSEAFVRRVANGEEVAVLLMDTQGMFDNETSMNLTACIFGLSTLLSSYQIYNVQNRIQEDNLQHLALFSEYGRIALAGEAGKLVRQGKKQGDEGTDKGHEEKSEGGVEAEELMLPDEDEIPFQRVEFLVRDWMDFDEDLPFHQLKVIIFSLFATRHVCHCLKSAQTHSRFFPLSLVFSWGPSRKPIELAVCSRSLSPAPFLTVSSMPLSGGDGLVLAGRDRKRFRQRPAPDEGADSGLLPEGSLLRPPSPRPGGSQEGLQRGGGPDQPLLPSASKPLRPRGFRARARGQAHPQAGLDGPGAPAVRVELRGNVQEWDAVSRGPDNAGSHGLGEQPKCDPAGLE